MSRVNQPISRITKLGLQTIGKAIKSARIEQNMSQQKLAQRLNVSRLTVIGIEKGNAKVAIGTVLEAATILQIPFFAEEGDLRMTANRITTISAILPKRAGRKKIELDDEF